MSINLDEVRKYLTEKGVKRISNPNFSVLFWLRKKLGGEECPEFDQRYHDRKNERIKETIPSEGEIILSGLSTIVMMYNEKSGKLEKANFDIMTGQPIPDSTYHVDYNQIIPVSLIEIVSFPGHAPLSEFRNPKSWIISDLARWNPEERKTQAAGFLEALLEFSEGVPVIEVGKNTGDTYNRRFPARKYNYR